MSDWRSRAACRGTDPESYFPISESVISPFDEQLIADAKAVCAVCPVAGECLEWALEHRCTHGVWGGLSSVERGRVIKRGKATSPPVDPQRVAEVQRLTDEGMSASKIAERMGMVQRVVVRYRARAREQVAT